MIVGGGGSPLLLSIVVASPPKSCLFGVSVRETMSYASAICAAGCFGRWWCLWPHIFTPIERVWRPVRDQPNHSHTSQTYVCVDMRAFGSRMLQFGRPIASLMKATKRGAVSNYFTWLTPQALGKKHTQTLVHTWRAIQVWLCSELRLSSTRSFSIQHTLINTHREAGPDFALDVRTLVQFTHSPCCDLPPKCHMCVCCILCCLACTFNQAHRNRPAAVCIEGTEYMRSHTSHSHTAIVTINLFEKIT